KTGTDGTYQFNNLNAGQYRVEITPPTGVQPSDPVFDPLAGGDNQNIGKAAPGGVIQSGLITLEPGAAPLVGGNTNKNNYVTGDFGLLGVAKLSGFVYRDPDNNGTFNVGAGDSPIGGVLITLTGTDLAGNPLPPRTTTTNGQGFYQFTELIPGNYTVRETQPGGILYDGKDTVGSLGGTVASNDVLTVRLDPNANGQNYNFGEIPPASIFGSVFAERVVNGSRDPGDAGIPGVPVVISGTTYLGTPLTEADVPGGLTAITDVNGRYQFPVLPPGQYTLTQARQPATFLDGLESNRDPVAEATIGQDVISSINAVPNSTYGPFDFGEIIPDPSKQQFLSTTPTATPNPTRRPMERMNPAFTLTTGTPDQPALVVAGVGAGMQPLVRVFDFATGGEKFRFFAYESTFTGGVRTATADFNGDGAADVITGTGVGGGPRLRVFDGTSGNLVHDFMAYEESFRGGLFVAGGDVNSDGVDDIITGVDTGGGPRVRVLDGKTLAVIRDFFAFDENQRGGVRVAAGDFNGDGKADIVATTGPGLTTRTRIIDVATLATIRDFSPFEPGFTGGVYISVGDVNGDGFADIVTGAERGGGPRVQTFDGRSLLPQASFFAYDPSFTGGVRVSTQDINGDGTVEIVTAPASGMMGRVRVYNSTGTTILDEFTAFDPEYLGGVYVG
ncbi:MAG: SdrD B-like domain-containing protein, partial [Gemmataceae bacterium]